MNGVPPERWRHPRAHDYPPPRYRPRGTRSSRATAVTPLEADTREFTETLRPTRGRGVSGSGERLLLRCGGALSLLSGPSRTDGTVGVERGGGISVKNHARLCGSLWGHFGTKSLEWTPPLGRSGASSCRFSAFLTMGAHWQSEGQGFDPPQLHQIFGRRRNGLRHLCSSWARAAGTATESRPPFPAFARATLSITRIWWPIHPGSGISAAILVAENPP
jgi:hypothetical protein